MLDRSTGFAVPPTEDGLLFSVGLLVVEEVVLSSVLSELVLSVEEVLSSVVLEVLSSVGLEVPDQRMCRRDHPLRYSKYAVRGLLPSICR